MGDAHRFMGLFMLVPASVLLSISFFVLLNLRKVDLKWLKSFGNLVVVLLWAAALVVLAGGVHKIIKNKPGMMGCPMMQMCAKKMAMCQSGPQGMQENRMMDKSMMKR